MFKLKVLLKVSKICFKETYIYKLVKSFKSYLSLISEYENSNLRITGNKALSENQKKLILK